MCPHVAASYNMIEREYLNVHYVSKCIKAIDAQITETKSGHFELMNEQVN